MENDFDDDMPDEIWASHASDYTCGDWMSSKREFYQTCYLKERWVTVDETGRCECGVDIHQDMKLPWTSHCRGCGGKIKRGEG